MPEPLAPDPATRDPRQPDWPLPELLSAAEAHWHDAARLRLLLRDLARRSEPGAQDLAGRVERRLRDLPAPDASEAQPRARVFRRGAPPLGQARPAPNLHLPPLPETPTPEMAALLHQLSLERASGDSARREAAALRERLAGQVPPEAHRREVEAARAEAREAREAAARLAERLAFVSAARVQDRANRADRADRAQANPRPQADPGPGPTSRARGPAAASRAARPAPALPDPAYAELGLDPDLPDDLLPVMERALLRHHHPDRAPPDQRDDATRRFQSVTRAFDRIRKLRGLPD